MVFILIESYAWFSRSTKWNVNSNFSTFSTLIMLIQILLIHFISFRKLILLYYFHRSFPTCCQDPQRTGATFFSSLSQRISSKQQHLTFLKLLPKFRKLPNLLLLESAWSTNPTCRISGPLILQNGWNTWSI